MLRCFEVEKMKYTKWLGLVCIILLCGCMYPEERLAKNQIPYKDQLVSVQTAVDAYKKDTGVLPIKTRDMSTPIYQKYPINFSILVPKYLSDTPGNSFENGGIFQYVLIEAETNPQVKLIDVRMASDIQDIKLRINFNKYPPFNKLISEGVYSLDFSKLNYKEELYTVSPYSGDNLPFVVDTTGEIYIDYRSDLYKALKKTTKVIKEGEDIRYLLTEGDNQIVPAFSLPYTVDKNREPVFMQSKK